MNNVRSTVKLINFVNLELLSDDGRPSIWTVRWKFS